MKRTLRQDDDFKEYIDDKQEINTKLNTKLYCPELLERNGTVGVACTNKAVERQSQQYLDSE